MYKEHPLFDLPSSDAVLWRYLSFTKFVSLLEKKALFFARADKLGDPFEGSFSEVNAVMRPALYGENHLDLSQQLSDFYRRSRGFTLISCWHESPHESAAMWRLYSRESDGIAVKSNCKSFTESLIDEEEVFVGKVSYVDYSNTFIPENNSLAPYLHKRKSFEHEHEVRAIIQKIPASDGKVDFSKDSYEVGKYYKVDISSLVQEVVVAPYAPEWFFGLVVSIAERYGLEAPVNKSVLADEPTWA